MYKRQVYWRGPVEVRVELIDIATDYTLSRAHTALLARPSAALAKSLTGLTQVAEVEDNHPVSYTHLDVYKRQVEILSD